MRNDCHKIITICRHKKAPAMQCILGKAIKDARTKKDDLEWMNKRKVLQPACATKKQRAKQQEK